MSDSLLADVVDGVYDLFAADSTLAALVTAKRLAISDGPPVDDFSRELMLVVGGLPIVGDEETGSDVSWSWATMGVSGAVSEVDEEISIPCGIAAKRGANTTNSTLRQVRRSAIGIYAACGSALRGSTLNLGRVMWCTSSMSRLQQMHTTTDGPECFVDFTALIRTRI